MRLRGAGGGGGEQEEKRRRDPPGGWHRAEDYARMTVDNKVEPAGGQATVSGDEEVDVEVDEGCVVCCGPEKSPLWAVIKMIICFFCGIVFGLALEKGRVFEPESIRNQMVFRQWTMLKMFLSAMATGQLVYAIMSVTPLRPLFSYVTIIFLLAVEDRGWLMCLLGPFILGVGMTFSGACPGMVLAQVGSWTKNSVYTFLGGLAGALIYGMFAIPLRNLTKPKQNLKYQTVPDRTGWFYAWIAFPMSLTLIAVVAALEIFIPWEADLPMSSRNPVNGTGNILFLTAWPPYISGAMIGVLQLVVAFAVKDSLGGTTGYVTLVSQWVVPFKLQNMFPYLARHRCGIFNWWQVFYVLGAMAGGFLSSFLSGTTGTTRGVGIPWAVGGGALMLFGARLASGCTSGHGISGMALLYFQSLVAVPSMFAGGIASAFALNGFGLLDNYVCADGPCGGTKA